MTDIRVEVTSKLKNAMDVILENNYGKFTTPPPLITPFGIRHLDAILGGGIGSSSPVLISSTPETGKTTLAFQFASLFQNQYKESIIMYLDVEGASNVESSVYFDNRMTTFKLDKTRFGYCPTIMSLEQVFKSIKEIIEIKTSFESTLKSKSSALKDQNLEDYEVKLLIIWDSIAATSTSKELESGDVNEVIGYKARELTYLMNKYRPLFMMNKVTFLIIDQIRSNIKITNRFQQADEKSVGDFKNYKSATSVSAFQHAVKQWIYLSKGQNYVDNGIDGYVINVILEKNKLAPSAISIPVIFDKKYGVNKYLSEYFFLSEMIKSEVKYTKNDPSKLIYPLAISSDSRSKVIRVIDPDSGEIVKESEKFSEKKFLTKINTEPEFKEIFDLAMKFSIENRIFKHVEV